MRSSLFLIASAVLGFVFIASDSIYSSEGAWRIIRGDDAAENLLKNPDFAGGLLDWNARSDRSRIDESGGREGGAALVCEVTDDKVESGASQSIRLDRKTIRPLVISGWSRAQDVSGAPDSGYAIYVDIIYQDGTSQWGKTAVFSTGTHDWQHSETVILPEKPVKSLSLYCLFRYHTGKVWFDDVKLSELELDAPLSQFDQHPIVVVDKKGDAATSGNLPADLPEGEDALLSHLKSTGHFLVRDVAAGSDFLSVEDAKKDLGLRVESVVRPSDGHLVVSGSVTSERAEDRAITLVYALPLDARGWQWVDSIRQTREIGDYGDFFSTLQVGAGATGAMSQYPLGVVSKGKQGVALGLDMGHPTIYRIGYNAGLRCLYIALDYGLAPETVRFPNRADFQFVVYPFESREGFRSAYKKYQEIFPDYFVVRARKQGIWMPFTDIATVEGAEDFGFRFHEGNNNVPWDDEHDVLSFRYTEPMTWWMRMDKKLDRTVKTAISERDRVAEAGKEWTAPMAQVTQLAAMHHENGEPAMLFRDTPWCDGAVWSVNPNPWLGGGYAGNASPLNGATIYWNPEIKAKLYGPGAKGKLDGEYLDSIEGYVTTTLNHRRDHFADTSVPLSYSPVTHQLALAKPLAIYEFTRWLSEDLHSDGRLLFANGGGNNYTFLTPWLDVLGTETNWMHQGEYRPQTIDRMDGVRTRCGAKPYLFLMNTNFDEFRGDKVEKFFNRCLFYGMWPGFFSHNASDKPYWQNPKLYNEDRPIFRRFIPLLRKVCEAGWQPEVIATCDSPSLLVERFGGTADKGAYLTVYNDTEADQAGVVRFTTKNGEAREWKVSLAPTQTAVIDVEGNTVSRP